MLYNNLYLFVNGKQASGIGLFADKDESQDVSLHFVVPEGDVSLMLCTDAVEVDEQTHEYKPAGYLVWTGDLNGTTGIVSPVVTPAESFDEAGSSLGNVAADGAAQVYDLQGRRVLRPTQKGVYIRNGRLHVVR